MASVANSAQSAKAPNSTPTPTLNQRDGLNRSSNKAAGNNKGTDRGRKESPVDQGRRAPAQQKAWTSGTNPLTQKSSSTAQSNGVSSNLKSTATQKPINQVDGGMSEKHSHDRLRFLLGGAVGLSVVLSTRSGDKFEGLFAGTALNAHTTKFTMKMVRMVSTGITKANGVAIQEAAFVGTSPEYAMTFDLKDVADMAIAQYSLPDPPKQANGTNSSFQTDADISKAAARGSERVLQKWVPDALVSTDISLESGSIGGWDQFAAHKNKFGDNSTYDENMYTTTIDRNAPGYKQREAHAARKAQEILGSTTNNIHMREERGLAAENDFEDEEDKYSGVRRNNEGFPPLSTGGANKYVPPAQRAPASHTTVVGAPVDSAIISAQLSKPKSTKPINKDSNDSSSTARDAALTPEPIPQPSLISGHKAEGSDPADKQSKTPSANANADESQPADTVRPIQRNIDNPTDDVEVKVLDQFRQFAKSEKERIAERKRAQANQDRTAKLNDLLRFSKTFKLPFPVPTDLVGILARDPAKQEAILEKAQKEHEEAKTASPPGQVSTSANSTNNSSSKIPSVPKFDASQVPPPIPERNSFSRSRGGHQNAGRGDRATSQQGQFATRGGAAFPPRATGQQQDRKFQIPAPIILADGRTPPTGPLAEQNISPQRSNVHTPTSAVPARFNVKAMEFRPNANAPTFNPSGSSIAPSSPASLQRTDSLSRAASPTSFFGARKPKADRTPASAQFNPLKRMKDEIAKKKNASEKSEEPVKDYPQNGGIPNAYHTGPVWQVKTENQEKSYLGYFGRSSTTVSPSQTRSGSVQHNFYNGQLPAAVGGGPGTSQITAPQHGAHGAAHIYGHQFDDQRMHSHASTSQAYSSPGMASRQMSNFSSPMPPQAQLVYGQPQFYNGPAQMNAQMRVFPGTPGMMHAQPGPMAAPMMVQQQSNGPYMTVPHYNQMPMYSPGTTHVYPQQNGYPSPGRVAPMMMHQGSQQGHHGGQPMMYAVGGQVAPVMYQQPSQGGMVRGGYGGSPYGSSPHQSHHMQHRAMSAGYGKGVPQVMNQNHGPPPNAPQQPAAFSPGDIGTDDAK